MGRNFPAWTTRPARAFFMRSGCCTKNAVEDSPGCTNAGAYSPGVRPHELDLLNVDTRLQVRFEEVELLLGVDDQLIVKV